MSGRHWLVPCVVDDYSKMVGFIPCSGGGSNIMAGVSDRTWPPQSWRCTAHWCADKPLIFSIHRTILPQLPAWPLSCTLLPLGARRRLKTVTTSLSGRVTGQSLLIRVISVRGAGSSPSSRCSTTMKDSYGASRHAHDLHPRCEQNATITPTFNPSRRGIRYKLLISMLRCTGNSCSWQPGKAFPSPKRSIWCSRHG
jgi:hypothetical protein